MSKRLSQTEKAVRAVIKMIEGMRDAAGPEFERAVQEWGETTAAEAQRNLDRPAWLLSAAIMDKVKPYSDGRKIWAMAGFKFSDGAADDPGSYGRYHEAGYYPARTPPAPPHFLRNAKQTTAPALLRNIEAVKKKMVEAAARAQTGETTAPKKERGALVTF